MDERILDEEGGSTPTTGASDCRGEDSSADGLVVERRLKVLVERGLVAPVTEGGFEITTWGQAYLQGDLDAPHLPRYSRRRASRPLY